MAGNFQVIAQSPGKKEKRRKIDQAVLAASLSTAQADAIARNAAQAESSARANRGAAFNRAIVSIEAAEHEVIDISSGEED